MKMFATILAGSECACTITAPHQYKATKFHASGPLTTGMWMKRGVVLWWK